MLYLTLLTQLLSAVFLLFHHGDMGAHVREYLAVYLPAFIVLTAVIVWAIRRYIQNYRGELRN